jgi:hypothetical protein
MSSTAISPHIAGLRLRPPWRSQPIGGRSYVKIHIDPTRACRQHRRRTGRGCTWLASRRNSRCRAAEARRAALDRIWIAQSTIDAKRRAEWEAACEAAGLPDRDFESFPSREEWFAYENKRVSIEPGLTDDSEREREKLGLLSVWDKIQDPFFPLVKEILSLKATTAGLAVLVKAVAYAASDLWDGDEDSGFTPHERMFIEAACAFCNITPWPIAQWRLKIAAEQNSWTLMAPSRQPLARRS